MILRSITKHVRDQNWFAVGLDFLIVVVGVFIGIQVANWNEARRESANAQAYLIRIQADLDEDRSLLESRVAFWQQIQRYGAAALAHAEHDQRLGDSSWDTVVAYYHATHVAGFSPADLTYRELVSAGDLGLIPAPDLRRAIGDYYIKLDQQFFFDIVPVYRDTIRGMTPWSINQYIWEVCFAAPALDDYRLLDCESPISEPEADALLAAFKARPEVPEQLRNWMRNLGLMVQWTEFNLAAAAELDRRIGAAVDSSMNKQEVTR